MLKQLLINLFFLVCVQSLYAQSQVLNDYIDQALDATQ